MVFFNKFLKFFLLLSIGAIYAQKHENPTIDKLIEKFSRNLHTQKDSALFYIQEAEKKSLQAKDNYYLSRSLFNKGYYYYTYNDNVKAKKLISDALHLGVKSQINKVIIASYSQLGKIEMDLGNFDKSSDYLFTGLRFARLKKIPEESMILNTLGLLYYKQNDTINSIKHFKEAEKISIKNNDKQRLFQIYTNLALCQNVKNIDETVRYHKKALNIAYELKDKNAQFDELINIGVTYIDANIPKSVLFYLMKAKEIAQELDDKTKFYYVYQNLGYYYYETNNFQKSLEMHLLALQNVQDNNFEQNLALYSGISNTYEKIGNFKDALKYNDKYQKLKDSVFTIEKNKNFNEIVTKYEVEKKNDQIKLLNQQKVIEKKRRNTIIIISVFIVLLLLSFAYFIFKRAQLQKKLRVQEEKTHKQEKEKLIKDQELKEVQALVEGQNEERNRIAKELHDGIAGDLAGIKLILTQENQKMKNENLHKIQNDLSSLFQEIRSISHNLSQNYTQNKTLRSLLSDLQKSYNGKQNFNFAIHIYPENATDHLDEIKKQHLYRVFQELLQNVSKHSEATEVELNITRNEDHLNIIFEDNGVGFDMDNFKGIGLKNIEERLKIIGARLSVDSYIGRGSTFIVELGI